LRRPVLAFVMSVGVKRFPESNFDLILME